MLVVSLAAAPAAPDGPVRRSESLFDQYPALKDFLLLFVGVGLVLLLYYFFRNAPAASGFVITADEHDITFSGNFPAKFEQTVIDFLRDDCRIPGEYQIRGHWEDRLLVIVVRGLTAAPHEQRIRNFLKLTLKKP